MLTTNAQIASTKHQFQKLMKKTLDDMIPKLKHFYDCRALHKVDAVLETAILMARTLVVDLLLLLYHYGRKSRYSQ